MKAAYFDGKRLVLRSDFPDPECGESLVRVTMAGICGTDLEMLDGYMDFCGVIGHEFVGVVVWSQNPALIGKRVVGEINAGCGSCDYCYNSMERHCPDRSVLGILNRNGAFAEFLSLPDGNLHVVPDSISDQQAVFVEPLAAAFEIAEQIRLRPKWDVAIVGDGRLAQLIARVLKLYCDGVVCYGRHPNKLVRLEELGIRTKTSVGSEDRYDLVVEATGSHSGFSDAIHLAKPRGTVVIKSTIASRECLDMTPAVINELTMVGSRCGVFRPAIEALATGAITVEDMIDYTYTLDEIDEAIEHARKPGTLKVLLKPDASD